MNCITNGIDLRRLPAGTKVIVHTLNSLYSLEILSEHGYCFVQGGEYFQTPQKVFFTGSTFGGSAIRIGWVSGGLCMEMHTEDEKVITTSPVRKAKVVGSDWDYELNWTKD